MRSCASEKRSYNSSLSLIVLFDTPAIRGSVGLDAAVGSRVYRRPPLGLIGMDARTNMLTKRLLMAAVAVLVAAGVVVAGEAKKDEVELQGKIGCGHCNYHKGDGCSVGLKTGDGKIYLLDNASKELMDARFDGGKLQVKGTVTDKDGTLHVHASSTKLEK
jgi:hypothetical protein